MREAYEGSSAKPLMPMQFAGIIIEGGIVGYDTSTTSGGAGMRVFGIGKQTQWSTDTVTVSLRAVSVNTGKVLSSVTVQKTILSTGDSATALKFYDQGTKAFEAEMGLTINEPGTYAVKAATEMAVVELIKEGQRKGVWDFKPEMSLKTQPPAMSFAPAQAVAPVISSELKAKEEQPVVAVEEKKEEKVVETAKVSTTQYLNIDTYVFKAPNESAQKTWLLKKGTELVVSPSEGDWVRVEDKLKHKGFVKKEVLVDKQ